EILRASDDGVVIPFAATRQRNSVTVKPGGDGARRHAGHIFAVDSADDLGLGLVDLAQSLDRLPLRVDPTEHPPIAITDFAGHPALAQNALMAAFPVGGEVGEKERTDEAADSDMNRSRDAFADRANLDAVKCQALVETRQILLVAREAVEAVD